MGGADAAIVLELPAREGKAIREGMAVRLAGQSGRVDYVYESGGATVVKASLDPGAEALPEGVYDAQIVTETLSPISFLLD